ncbi:MAG: sensor histidine kinase, partial [Cyanobacteria bacterium J06626_14]
VVDLGSYCQKLLSDFKTSSSKTREIQFQVQGDAADVYVDTELIETILSNLLSNALKYSPVDRPVSLSLKYLPSQVIFAIQDQGRGIPKEDQPALFEAFFRARNVGATPGTGLGLSIVKQCVDLHGGAIAIQSEVDAGSTFIVTLPSKIISDV